MAHYALVNEQNVVVEVVVGRDELELGVDWEQYYSARSGLRAIRTSYNTIAGQHRTGGVPFRGNYAGIGFVYREDLDAFIPPQPSDDAVLNTTTFSWEQP